MNVKQAPRENEKAPCIPIRLIIVDDHPLVRYGLTQLIAGQADMNVCGEADTLETAIGAVAAHSPDVAIVDLTLEKGSGLDLVKYIRNARLPVKVIILSMHQEFLYAERAIRAGAMGYLNKKTANREIISAIRRVQKGRKYLSSDLLEYIQDRIGFGNVAIASSPMETLSDRELEVFLLIANGLGNRQIAEHLCVSVRTIETHKERIKNKLGLANAGELTRRAMQWTMEGPGVK